MSGNPNKKEPAALTCKEAYGSKGYHTKNYDHVGITVKYNL
jgi:hypothetical protein